MVIVGGHLVKLVTICDLSNGEILAGFSIHSAEDYGKALKWIDDNAYEHSGSEFDDTVEKIWVADLLYAEEEAWV